MPDTRGFSVFLSYATDDRGPALRIASALRAAGIDVWFDAEELRGGDVWDDLIRRQIQDCSFFVALLSPATQARAEGYFRREWKFALERSLDMAEDRLFILPVTLSPIDAVSARVPHRFRELQWTHLPDGEGAEELAKRLQSLHDRIAAGGYPQPAGSTGLPSRLRNRRWTAGRAASVAVVLGLAAAAAGLWRTRRPAASDASASLPAMDAHAVAVLPFANDSGDPQDEYLTDGLSEELISTLYRDSSLRVVARTSSFAFKGKALTVQQIAAQLGAGLLVEGSVRREGEILKLAVRIIAGSTGFGIWARDYEVRPNEILETEATLADDVAAQLLPAGAHPVYRAATTRNMDAYDAYLRGRSFQMKPAIAANLEAAAGYYRQAVRFDPDYALAWARYGTVLIREHTVGVDDSESTLKAAHAAVARALSLQPDLPEAHYALASYYTLNWTNQALAEKELLLARQGLPNDPDILGALAGSALNQWRPQEAVDYIRQATSLDPQNADTASYAASVLDFASDYPEALAERERAYRLGGWVGTIIEKAFVYRDWRGDLALTEKTLDAAAPAALGGSAANDYWRVKVGLLRAQHRYPEALAAIDRIDTEILPLIMYYNSRSLLRAWVDEALGRAGEARANYERARGYAEKYRDDHPKLERAHTSLALIYAGLGREADARAEADRCLALIPPADNPFVAARAGLRVLAQIEARFHHADAALEIVRRQAAVGLWKRYDLLLDPDFEVLRRDPRFIALAKQAPL